MVFGNWKSKPAPEPAAHGDPVALDLSATRVLACSPRGDGFRAVLLDDAGDDLPLAVSIESKPAVVGRHALTHVRKTAHLAVLGYLGQLGDAAEWRNGRVQVTPESALALAIERVHARTGFAPAVGLALPAYLKPTQVQAIAGAMNRGKVPLCGTIAAPLAIGASAHQCEREAMVLRSAVGPAPRTESGLPPLVLFADCDDYALTLTLLQLDGTQAKALATVTRPTLSRRMWKERLLDRASDHCIRICRRDPRDDAAAEQMLYDQFDDAMDRSRAGQRLSLGVRSERWYQDIVLQPEDFESYGAGLGQQAARDARALVEGAMLREPPRSAWLTHEAGRLPGLPGALHALLGPQSEVRLLAPHAVAHAAARLLHPWATSRLPRTHLEVSAPLVAQ